MCKENTIQRDYREALGGGDPPAGGVLPRAQRDLRKAQIEQIEKAEKGFKQATGILPRDEEIVKPMAQMNSAKDDFELEDHRDTRSQYTLSQASLSDDEPIESVEDSRAEQSRGVEMEDGSNVEVSPQRSAAGAAQLEVPQSSVATRTPLSARDPNNTLTLQ